MNAGSRVVPGPPPRRVSGARFAALVLALALLALGVAGAQALAAAQGWTRAESWVTAAVRSVDGLTADTVVLVVGTVVGLLGLLLLVGAVSPPRASHRFAGSEGQVELWVSRGAVAVIAADAADRAEGVLSARARTTRRGAKVDVVARGVSGRAERRRAAQVVHSAIDERLAGLSPAAGSKISVTVKEETS